VTSSILSIDLQKDSGLPSIALLGICYSLSADDVAIVVMFLSFKILSTSKSVSIDQQRDVFVIDLTI